MGELVLNALMHLFAIVANANNKGISQKERGVVEGFLSRYVSTRLKAEYLDLFENYIEFYNKETEFKTEDQTKQSDAEALKKISKICHNIKTELIQEERIIVLLRLLELIYNDKIITKNEFEIINAAAECFKISRPELINIMAFICGDSIKNFNKSKFLIIDNIVTEWSENLSWVMQKETKDNDYKHLYCENLYGKITVMYVESINLFLFKYEGELSIYQEGNKIIPKQTYQLSSGSIIKGPNIRSIYYNEIVEKFLEEETRKKIIFTAQDIEFKFRNSPNGIQKFSMTVESGQLVGIMGGSGVGKSTLLNVLNGNLSLNNGEIKINGYNINEKQLIIKGLIGFVPQDDLLIEELTVLQNLYFNAKLCFKDFNKTQILKTVLNMLHDLDLYEAKDLKIGNPLNQYISGGQRKRLNIGLELMREPSILLIDEPTSGLSSTDSEMVIRLLKQQTLKGKLVIANIHQPSSDNFKILDKLWVIDRGGFIVYTGNPIDAIVYFKTQDSQVDALQSECANCGNVNPEQILQIIEAKKIDEQGKTTRERKTKPQEWYSKYKNNIEKKLTIPRKKKDLPQSDFKIPKTLKQFYVFWIRNMLAKLANKQYMFINLLEAPLLAIILGYFSKYVLGDQYIFGENKNLPVFLFMAVIVSMFMGLTVSAEEIINDRKILKRESFLNLSKTSYLFSKILFLFLLSAIQTITFVILGNLILEIRVMTLNYWLILFTISCFSNMLGLNISSGLNSIIAIYILIPLILVPHLLFGGAMIKFDEMHSGITNKIYVPIIGDFFATRWAYEALAVTQFKDNKFQKKFFNYEKGISDAAFKTSFLIPRLETMLIQCERNIEFEKDEQQTEILFTIIQNEINHLADNAKIKTFPEIKNLNKNNFSLKTAEQTRNFLDQQKLYFAGIGRESNYKKDFEYNRLVDSLGREGFYQFKQKYHNSSLSDLLLNRDEVNKLIVVEKHLIQKKDPIFMYPESHFGRAHFYSPVKQLGNNYFDTFWFNIVVIWIGTCLLYLTLRLEILRKIVNYIESLQIILLEKKRRKN